METIRENQLLSDEEKKSRLKNAKIGEVYDGWTPYCMMYKKSPRMISMNYGFVCPDCGNMIGFNLTRLQESPLNKK